MLTRIFPKQIDNTRRGHPAALWLLLAFVLLKFLMSANSLLNTRSVATGGDGIPLDAMTPEGVQVTLRLPGSHLRPEVPLTLNALPHRAADTVAA